MAADEIHERTPRTLSIISAAMGLGLAGLMAAIVSSHIYCHRIPSPTDVAQVNRMTGLAMMSALAAIVASQVVWKAQLKRVAPDTLDAAVLAAFIQRTALREMAALFGAVIALIAALKGVLKVYPVYWGNLIPAWLFFGYLAMHWPTRENLRSQIGVVDAK